MTGILTYLSTESYKMHFVEADTGNEYEVDFQEEQISRTDMAP